MPLYFTYLLPLLYTAFRVRPERPEHRTPPHPSDSHACRAPTLELRSVSARMVTGNDFA